MCYIFVVALVFGINQSAVSIPIQDILKNVSTSVIPLESVNSNATSNGTQKDLYVIKAVVYEIGILTEVDENSTSDDYSHERVDLTFFDAHSNGSHFDLGEIPLPVQTNVTGQVLTGIAPIQLGAIQNASDILSTLPLTGTIINITHSDTSYITLNHRPAISENGTILNADDIKKIPGVNNSNAIFIDNTNRGSDESGESDESDR